jgi:hypothetical protein
MKFGQPNYDTQTEGNAMDWETVEQRLFEVYETTADVAEQDAAFEAIAAEFEAAGDATTAVRVRCWAEL